MKALLLIYALLATPASAEMKHLLSMQAEISTGTVMAGKEVPVKLTIKNTSEVAIDLPWSKWISQFITTDSFLLIGKGSPATIKHTGLSLGNGKYPGGPLAPGHEIVVDVLHVFPKAGLHALTATLKLPEEHQGHFWGGLGAIKSKPIRVVVANPADNHSLDRPAAR